MTMTLISVVRQAIKQSEADIRVYYICKRGNILYCNLTIRKHSRLICHVCGKEIIKNAKT
jgi:hypothetical protein